MRESTRQRMQGQRRKRVFDSAAMPSAKSQNKKKRVPMVLVPPIEFNMIPDSQSDFVFLFCGGGQISRVIFSAPTSPKQDIPVLVRFETPAESVERRFSIRPGITVIENPIEIPAGTLIRVRVPGDRSLIAVGGQFVPDVRECRKAREEDASNHTPKEIREIPRIDAGGSEGQVEDAQEKE